MKRLLFLLLPFALALAACSPSASSNQAPTPTDDPDLIPTLFPNSSANRDLTRVDEQGMVVMEVTPLNLGTPADTLEFNIAMNTHSVDLSMDLAALSTVTTDTGLTIPATLWDANPGGHHVSGKLVFSSIKDGQPILEGAGKLTLTILNVDAPSRVFEWQLR